MISHNSNPYRQTRHILRNNPTPAEERLWQELKGHQIEGYKFRRQHGIGRYIVDFFCSSLRLIIEIDGLIHEAQHVATQDNLREKELHNAGFTILRFTNEEVLRELDVVLNKIRSRCLTSENKESKRLSPVLT